MLVSSRASRPASASLFAIFSSPVSSSTSNPASKSFRGTCHRSPPPCARSAPLIVTAFSRPESPADHSMSTTGRADPGRVHHQPPTRLNLQMPHNLAHPLDRLRICSAQRHSLQMSKR